MKPIVPCVLVMAVGCILAAGCVATTNKDTVNPISPTSEPGPDTTVTATSVLNGSLKVSISGITDPVNLSVVLDNQTVGTVNPATPLFLMVSEGNHTVRVCMSSICEQENVTTRFGKYVTVDFSEQLHRDGAIAQPTARILGYYKNGNTISVTMEFINPSAKDVVMTVAVTCGYSYIDDRTSLKMGDSARGMLVQNVKAGQRITESLNLNFAGGGNFNYGYPVIEELMIK